MADIQSKCTGNCMACTIFQRQYCASQLAYSNMRMLEQMQQTVKNLSDKIDAIQNSEAALFDPIQSNKSNVLDENRPTPQPTPTPTAQAAKPIAQ